MNKKAEVENKLEVFFFNLRVKFALIVKPKQLNNGNCPTTKLSAVFLDYVERSTTLRWLKFN